MITTDYMGRMNHEVLKMLHMTNVHRAIATFTTEIHMTTYFDDNQIYMIFHVFICRTTHVIKCIIVIFVQPALASQGP